MKHANLEDAVDAALDRIGAMLGAGQGEEVAGVVQQPGVAFAGLDVVADEVFDVAERVTRAYLDQVDVTNNAGIAVRGAFLTGYLVGRLHDPGIGLCPECGGELHLFADYPGPDGNVDVLRCEDCDYTRPA